MASDKAFYTLFLNGTKPVLVLKESGYGPNTFLDSFSQWVEICNGFKSIRLRGRAKKFPG